MLEPLLHPLSEFLSGFWPLVVGTLSTLLALATSLNAVLHKRDERATIGWVGLIWLVPILGPVLYVLLGVNRIERRATELRRDWPRLHPITTVADPAPGSEISLPELDRRMTTLVRVVNRVSNLPLTAGNRVTPLCNGDEAFPAMLAAIDAASTSLALSTYIFDNDPAGHRFVQALGAARRRGVQVRVLVDGIGARYSWPPIHHRLQQQGVPCAYFLNSLWPWRMPYMNLRTHRKILVADGRIGFTGGMNIRQGNVLRAQPEQPIKDLHFRLEGPVVAHMMATFAEDWAFTTRELLEGEDWFPPLQAAGPVVARGIAAGPDADFEKLRWTMLGALNQARDSVRILTPYFLPDQTLVTALRLAAMRGVTVDILLPERNNLPLVQWACDAGLWQVLAYGCQVFLTPPPFDHAKAMLVDDSWAFVGSANWDPRSLRLNFEFNVECYDTRLVSELNAVIDARLRQARPLPLAEVDARPLAVKLRDGVARLFSPYL